MKGRTNLVFAISGGLNPHVTSYCHMNPYEPQTVCRMSVASTPLRSWDFPELPSNRERALFVAGSACNWDDGHSCIELLKGWTKNIWLLSNNNNNNYNYNYNYNYCYCYYYYYYYYYY